MGQDPPTVLSVCVAWGCGDSRSLTPAELWACMCGHTCVFTQLCVMCVPLYMRAHVSVMHM